MGKVAISLGILDAEKSSHFREDVKDPQQDWYFYLYNRLTRNLTAQNSYPDFPRGNIAFITFNYDRSLEYFLFNSILHSFQGMDSAQAIELMQQMPITHVYGQVGGLDWQDARAKTKYGSEIQDFSQIDLLPITKDLYVVHEERTNPQLEKAREEIRKAERIFFLGFGYADENLEVLGIPDGLRAEHDIYGTAMGWTPKEIYDIRSRFAAGLRQAGNVLGGRDQVLIRDCDCVSLLREFL